MDFKMELVPEYIFEARCNTCLSLGRQLSPLGKYAGVYTTLAGPFYSLHTLPTVSICWECKAALRNIIIFQHKVQKAAISLTQGCNNAKSLSRLATTLITDYSLMQHSESDSESETDFKTDIPIEQCDLPQDDAYLYDIEPDEIKVESNEIKLEEKKIKQEHDEVKPESGGNKEESGENNLRKKKRKPLWELNREEELKKPKFQFVAIKNASKKDMYNQIRINPTELRECLAEERNCTYYTRTKFKCEKCIIGFGTKKALMKHNAAKHAKDLGKVVCDICKTRFRGKCNLLTHIRSHYYKYECKVCAYTSFGMRNMLWHYRSQHARVAECLVCRMRFVNRNEFYKHYRASHELFICDYCGAHYRMRYSLINHIRRHHMRGRIACEQCGKTFKSDNGCWQHKKLLHPPRQLDPAYCVECDKHFRHRYAYVGHINRKHKPAKAARKSRHQCPDCEKTFSKNIYMKNHHEFVHLKIYKNRCDPCGRKFLRPAELIRHNRQTHEGIPAPKNKLCYICGRGFTCNKILANHIRVHTGERPFACVRCPARFTQRTALVTHMKNVHHEKYTPPPPPPPSE